MNETPELLFATSVHSRDKPPGRIGGCVGTFLQLFDWNPRKRLFSTKRLPAERPTRKASKKKFKDERMPVAKLLLLAEEENRGGFPSPKKVSAASSVAGCGDRSKDNDDEHPGKRVPGVVARLMGLESMPDCNFGSEGKESPQHPKLSPVVEVRPLQELLHVRQEPVLLQDLLREREYLEAKKLSLKERLQVPVPGFGKKFPDPPPPMQYHPPKDGFKKSTRSETLQPYSEQKYHKSLRPIRKSNRDLSDAKHLILALSPRASSDSLRPILLPSKVHNKLMSSPIKSPTKMGSRSARLLEAAVKILEPSLQSSAARARPPPVRPSTTYKDMKDLEAENPKVEGKKERLPMVEKKVAISSNAGRVLKGQSMSRSWNGREETGRYNHDMKSGSSVHDVSGRRRSDHHASSQSRPASPMRTSNHRSRSGRVSVPSDEPIRGAEEVKSVVPQGFEEAYTGGLKPLNVGRREEIRLDKYEMEDSRRVAEKHVVSSLSVGNSPYSETSDRGAPTSFHDPLRRSGSTKEGPTPPTPSSASRSRFLRSKSVKEEKISKSASGQFTHQYKHQRESRIKQDQPPHPASALTPTPAIAHQEPESKLEAPALNVTDLNEDVSGVLRTIKPIKVKTVVPQSTDQELPARVLPPVPSDATLPSSADQPKSTNLAPAPMPAAKQVAVPVQSRSSSGGGGLLSYSQRLFGARKGSGGDRKSDPSLLKSKSKEENSKGRSEVSYRKTESSLVRSLLRRKAFPQPAAPAASPVVLPSENKKKSAPRRNSQSVKPAESNDCDIPGDLSEEFSVEGECDSASNLSTTNDHLTEVSKERTIQLAGEDLRSSPSKCVDDVFPEVPLDKGCLKLLDDDSQSIEGFDCVDVNPQRMRGGILNYAAQLMDDLKLEEMFTTGTVMQGHGRGGFSYSPLVELEDPPRSSLEGYVLEEGVEVEKCVSFLGRTSVPTPEANLFKREVNANVEAEDEINKSGNDQRVRIPLGIAEANTPAAEDVKSQLMGEVFESRETDDDEERVERMSKKFAPKGRVVVPEVDGCEEPVCIPTREDCGQPSPVSVLDCPFEDETSSSQGNLHENICELEDDLEDEEEALIDDLLFESAAALQRPRKQKSRSRKNTVVPLTDLEISQHSPIENEKIVGAILDISRFRCIDPSAIGFSVGNSESHQEEEEEYIAKVLSVWESFPQGPGELAISDLPINTSLFDRLESQERAFAWRREKVREESLSQEECAPRTFKQWQSLWLQRRLLFDCVNETLGYRLKFKYSDPWIAKPALRPQPKGKELVKEVYREIMDWRSGVSEELDTIIESDMSRGPGNWSNRNQEISEIGLEIERTIFRVMIEELVSEMTTITARGTGGHAQAAAA